MTDTLATLSATVPPIELPPSALAVAVPGRSDALAEGARARVELRGTAMRIEVDGRRLVDAVDGPGPVANTLLTPGLVRRERAGPDGLVAETILTAPTLPLVWLQWTPAPGSAMPAIRIRLPEGVALRPPSNPVGRLADVSPGDGEADVLALWLSGPAELVTAPGDPAEVIVRPAGSGRGTVTLALSIGDERTLRGTSAAAPHAAAHARRAGAGPTEGLLARTGVAEIDDGVAWGRVRVAAAARRSRSASSPDDRRALLTLGLASLAVGDAEGARHLLARLPEGSGEAALLAGRFSATTGEAGPSMRAADALLTGEASADPDIGALAATALADGLRYAAPDERITALRDLGTRLAARRGRSAEGATVRRLPMAGQGDGATSDPAFGTWLGGALAGSPSRPPPASDPDVARLRGAAADFALDPDRAWVAWRDIVAGGLERGPGGPATWDDPGSDPAVAAELLLTLAHGLLGLGPDAPVGRLSLAPRLPTHLRSFEVEGIALGDASLTLSFRRDGSTHRYELAPSVASVPPLVVLEPSVPGSVTSARVDGADAELDARRVGNRSIVSVQLPVDGVRTLEIDVDPA